MEILFTSWDNPDLHVTIKDSGAMIHQSVPRVGEYMQFNLPEKETKWMRVAYVNYEYFSINPDKLRAHIYLEEIDGDPPFYRPKEEEP